MWILIEISLKFFPRGPINDIPSLVQIMAWWRPSDKPLSEPMMVKLLTHICVTRPQWVEFVLFFFRSIIDLSLICFEWIQQVCQCPVNFLKSINLNNLSLRLTVTRVDLLGFADIFLWRLASCLEVVITTKDEDLAKQNKIQNFRILMNPPFTSMLPRVIKHPGIV